MTRATNRTVQRTEPDARSSSRRSEIVSAALEVFAERGYVGASVREIADRLNISKGNLTYHFAVKDDLLFEIVTDLHDAFLELARTWSEQAADAPRAALHDALREHVLLVARRVSQTRVSYEAFRYLTDARRADIVDRRDRYESALRDLISRAQRSAGRRARATTDLQVRTVLGMLNWPYQWYSSHGEIDPDELAQIVAEMALRALQL